MSTRNRGRSPDRSLARFLLPNARLLPWNAPSAVGQPNDAYYGTDALGDLPKGKGYDGRGRGARVVVQAKAFLD